MALILTWIFKQTRDQLLNNINVGNYSLTVDLKDLNSFYPELYALVCSKPTEIIPLVLPNPTFCSSTWNQDFIFSVFFFTSSHKQPKKWLNDSKTLMMKSKSCFKVHNRQSQCEDWWPHKSPSLWQCLGLSFLRLGSKPKPHRSPSCVAIVITWKGLSAKKGLVVQICHKHAMLLRMPIRMKKSQYGD